jgi:hypothetical protein
MIGTATLQVMCSSVRYRDAETIVPNCHLSRRFLRTASPNFCKLRVEMAINILARRYELMVHQTAVNFLIAPSIARMYLRKFKNFFKLTL